jgi:hypothetical protein
MLGVPPKSSGGVTNRCVMSRLMKCRAGPFQIGIPQQSLGPHRFLAGPDNAGYPWLGRPILLPTAMQFFDRRT